MTPPSPTAQPSSDVGKVTARSVAPVGDSTRFHAPTGAAVGLGLADPQVSLAQTAMAAIALGIAGATFDIVIDAYRTDLLPEQERGAGAAANSLGYRGGTLLLGSGALLGNAFVPGMMLTPSLAIGRWLGMTLPIGA